MCKSIAATGNTKYLKVTCNALLTACDKGGQWQSFGLRTTTAQNYSTVPRVPHRSQQLCTVPLRCPESLGKDRSYISPPAQCCQLQPGSEPRISNKNFLSKGGFHFGWCVIVAFSHKDSRWTPRCVAYLGNDKPCCAILGSIAGLVFSNFGPVFTNLQNVSRWAKHAQPRSILLNKCTSRNLPIFTIIW